MKAIKEKNKVIDEIIEEFSRPDFLVCVQKSERFECVSLPHSDMTQLRVKATLGTLITNRLREYSKKNGTEITINNRRRLATIQTILQKVMTDNIVDEAFDKVSGWPKGIIEYGQQKFLVRKEIEPVDPRSGNWDELRKLFETGFGLNTDERGEEQLHAFYSLVRAKLLQMRAGFPIAVRALCWFWSARKIQEKPSLVPVESSAGAGRKSYRSLCRDKRVDRRTTLLPRALLRRSLKRRLLFL